MNISAHLIAHRGESYRYPYAEVIESLEWCDEVIVGIDPRFKDNTLKKLASIEDNTSNVRIVVKEFDFDSLNPHGDIKESLRLQCQGDWIIELDVTEYLIADEETVRTFLEKQPSHVNLVAAKVIHLFNGKWQHKDMPEIRPFLSRNINILKHSTGEANFHGRFGAAYTTELLDNILSCRNLAFSNASAKAISFLDWYSKVSLLFRRKRISPVLGTSPFVWITSKSRI